LFSFFFSSRRRHTRFSRDWSSDVCSSDLTGSDRGLGRPTIEKLTSRGVRPSDYLVDGGFAKNQDIEWAHQEGIKLWCPPAHSKRSEEHTSELQSRENLVCRLLLEKKKQNT